MKRNLLIIGLVISIFGFTGIAFAHNDNPNNCNENNPENCPNPSQICNQGNDADHNPHCVTFTPTPTLSLSCTPTPTDEEKPTDAVTPDLSLTPTAGISATITFTPTPTNQPNSSSGGDGRSDGLSSCPDCTKAHPNNGNTPQKPPETGRAEE